jgi:hypothetical protein
MKDSPQMMDSSEVFRSRPKVTREPTNDENLYDLSLLLRSDSELISISDDELRYHHQYHKDRNRIKKAETKIESLNNEIEIIKSYLNSLIMSERDQLLPSVIKVCCF